MDANMPGPQSNRNGTLSGLLLVLLVQVSTTEILKTIVLAATGALVSFLVTVGLKWAQRRYRRLRH